MSGVGARGQAARVDGNQEDRDEVTAGALLRRFARAIDRRDWEGLRDVLHAEVDVRYAYDGERFDRDGFVRLNADYPGLWRLEVQRLVDRSEERRVGKECLL